MGDNDNNQPSVFYFVCGTPRSGTSFLCERLSDTQIAGCPKEYFLAPEVPEWSARWGTVSYLHDPAKAIAEGTTPNGVFGAKVMWANFGDLEVRLRELTGDKRTPMHQLLEAIFPNLQYVFITRLDKIAQGVSAWKALQTDEWASWEKGPGRSRGLQFNYLLINDQVTDIIYHEAGWARYFAASGISPVTVVYEDLVQHCQANILRVLNELHISAPTDFQARESRLQKQADELSSAWSKRYLKLAKRATKFGILLSMPRILRTSTLRRYYVQRRLALRLERLLSAYKSER